MGGDTHLNIVSSRQSISALKVEEMSCSADDTLLDSAAAPEAKVV